MPEIQPPKITADVLDTPESLFALLLELIDQGWHGSVNDAYPDNTLAVGWATQVVMADAAAVDGRRTMLARIGDYKVVVGTTINVLTPAAYAATYGLPPQ